MAEKTKIIGRGKELEQLATAFELERNLLIEGPVGVGKTFLVQEVLSDIASAFHRIDGDTRYSEQKLTGWFDPPLVLKKGYTKETFIEGPLVTAMRKGQPLFINELNRMPEAVQNILLPAMDEKKIQLPRMGEVVAKKGFFVIATQNPREFTATHALSEALLDRFEMIRLEYQTKTEEMEILGTQTKGVPSNVIERAVDLVRSTREHKAIRRGASVRAALAICELVRGGMEFEAASLLALPSRIELVSSEENIQKLILELLSNISLPHIDQKKKR